MLIRLTVLSLLMRWTGFLATGKTIKAAGADYFVDSANTYVGTGSAKVYTITIEFKDEAAYNNFATSKTAQAVTVSEGATLKTGATVYYTTSAANVANNVFVVSYVY